jgi:DNA-binding NarL/FixJ family response regulator
MTRFSRPARHVADDLLIRVLVGDASRMASQLIAGQLRSGRSPRFETILPNGFASQTIADEIIRTRPDVALISGVLQDSSFAGYSVLRTIQPLNLPTRPILLMEDCEHDLVVDAFRSGARGVFSRAESSERLSKCIYTVHKGQIWAGTRELDYILKELVATRPVRIVDAHGSSLLSKREEEEVALVADGLTNRQISEQLKLSEHTVKNYLFKVFEKLGISTRVELVLYALSQNHRRDPALEPVRIQQTTRRQSTALPSIARGLRIEP